MSETLHFWLVFALGLALAVAGIIAGIWAEEQARKRPVVPAVIALGGVVMITAAVVWRDQAMSLFQSTSVLLLLLGTSFFMIWLVLLRRPLHDYSEGSKDVSRNSK